MSAVGGASLRYFQQSQQLSGQNIQLRLQKTAEDSGAIVQHSYNSTIKNQQNQVNVLQYSLQRGQGLDMLV